jgi:hypothetical protein
LYFTQCISFKKEDEASMRPGFRWLYWSGMSASALILLLLGGVLMILKPTATEPEQVNELIEPPQVSETKEPKQAGEALEPQQMGEPTGPGHVTKANFALVRKGMSRDEVDSLLGRENRFLGGSDTGLARVKIGGNSEQRIYEEGKGRLPRRAFVTFEMRGFTVVEKQFFDEPTNPGHVTEANFARIHNGMGEDEVDYLLGPEHKRHDSYQTHPRLSRVDYEEGQGASRKVATVHFGWGSRASPDGRIDHVYIVDDKLFETNGKNTGWRFGTQRRGSIRIQIADPP